MLRLLLDMLEKGGVLGAYRKRKRIGKGMLLVFLADGEGHCFRLGRREGVALEFGEDCGEGSLKLNMGTLQVSRGPTRSYLKRQRTGLRAGFNIMNPVYVTVLA